MNYDDENRRFHKSVRSIVLMALLGFMGLFIFLFKTNNCRPEKEQCQDSFVEVKDEYSGTIFRCASGSKAEYVTEPKRGIMCRCHIDQPEASPASNPRN